MDTPRLEDGDTWYPDSEEQKTQFFASWLVENFRLFKKVVSDAIWKIGDTRLEDLAHELMHHVYENRFAYDPKKGTIQKWVYVVARRRLNQIVQTHLYEAQRRCETLTEFFKFYNRENDKNHAPQQMNNANLQAMWDSAQYELSPSNRQLLQEMLTKMTEQETTIMEMSAMGMLDADIAEVVGLPARRVNVIRYTVRRRALTLLNRHK